MGALAQQLALAGLTNAVASVIENALGASSSVTGQQLSESLVRAGLDNEAADVLAARILALPNGAVSSVGLNSDGALVGPGGVVLDVEAANAATEKTVFVTEPRFANLPAAPGNWTLALQAACDFQYERGGGIVRVPAGKYSFVNTVYVPQRVWVIGDGGSFVNQYVTGAAEAIGTVLFMADGSNTNCLVFRCRLQDNGSGVLYEEVLNRRNSEARHGGGARDLIVWGNRSLNQSPAVKDINTAGTGIRIMGARYVILDNVYTMFCADDGVKVQSYDYGLGALSSNNITLDRCTSMSNGGSGFDVACGDSQASRLVAGYNGGTGLTWGMSGSLVGGLAWNNFGHGVYVSGLSGVAASSISGFSSYDNKQAGFYLGTVESGISLTGCVAKGNGTNTAEPATVRANYIVSAETKGWRLVGCQSFGTDENGTTITQYGYRINNTTHPGVWEGCVDVGSATPQYIADFNNLIFHGGSTTAVPHPPLKMLGTLDLNANILAGVTSARFNGWGSISTLTSGAITIGGNSLYSLNIAGGGTITDMTYSSTGVPLLILRNINATTVTIAHNTAKIRCANATDIQLQTNETAMFVLVSGSIWQQIGVAA